MEDIIQNIKIALDSLKNTSDRLWLTQSQNEESYGLSNSDNLVNNKIDSINERFVTLEKSLTGQEISPNFRTLLDNFLNVINADMQVSDFVHFNDQIDILRNDAEKLSFFTNIAVLKNTAVIVGANGSGKSTFVNSLGEMSLPNLTVIPAQKNLYFSEHAYKREQADVNRYRQDNLGASNDAYKIDRSSESEAITKLFEPFSLMITALVNEVAQISTDERNFDKSKKTMPKWDELTLIWKMMIPEVSFRIDAIKRKVYPIRNNQQYSINKLSDGEKCILYYIGNVLLAKDNAYIVVDEPETFLNAAIYNKLWDTLIAERQDCQFVFTSHNPEFITARQNASIIWCKQFLPPDIVELRLLDFENTLPIELLTELVGSRKKILFCEGTESSYDFQIFSAIFLDEYTVKPVGGHDKVIQYTKTFNALPNWVDNSAVGIIDRDGMSADEVSSLSTSEVFTLPYNEIEMLLINERVMDSVLQLSHEENDISLIVTNFKSKFIGLLTREKERLVYTLAKSRVDSELNKQFIDSKRVKTSSQLVKMVSELPDRIAAQNIVEGYTQEVGTALENQNYDQLLQICSLKGEIVNGLCNHYLQPGYASLAIGRISRDKDLKDYLRHSIDVIK